MSAVIIDYRKEFTELSLANAQLRTERIRRRIDAILARMERDAAADAARRANPDQMPSDCAYPDGTT